MAVVSQPGNRSSGMALPGKLDEKLDEFWVGNPWAIVRDGHNLSAFERNRVYLYVDTEGAWAQKGPALPPSMIERITCMALAASSRLTGMWRPRGSLRRA